MRPARTRPSPPARIEYLKVQNFRALRELELKDLTPLTVLLGPNGSGKSIFLDALRPEEVRMLWRDEQGYTEARRASEVPGVPEFVEHGALLGHLWMEGQLGAGDPLVDQGSPAHTLAMFRDAIGEAVG